MNGKSAIPTGPPDPKSAMLDLLEEWTRGGMPQRAESRACDLFSSSIVRFAVARHEDNLYRFGVVLVYGPGCLPEAHLAQGGREDARTFLVRKGIPTIRLVDAVAALPTAPTNNPTTES